MFVVTGLSYDWSLEIMLQNWILLIHYYHFLFTSVYTCIFKESSLDTNKFIFGVTYPHNVTNLLFSCITLYNNEWKCSLLKEWTEWNSIENVYFTLFGVTSGSLEDLLVIPEVTPKRVKIQFLLQIHSNFTPFLKFTP